MDIIIEAFLQAPEELKQKGIAHRESIKRFNRALQQAKLWKDEFAIASEFYIITEKDYQDAMKRYNPETKTLNDPKEILAE